MSDLHQAGIVHGNLDPTHVLLDPYGRPVLCGFGDADHLDGPHGPRASTDVAGLGGLLASLLTDDDEAASDHQATTPRSWRRRPGRRRAGESRALLAIAEHATATDPLARPGLRAFIDALRRAAPDAALPLENGTRLLGWRRSPDDPSSAATSPATDPLLALLADPAPRDGPDRERGDLCDCGHGSPSSGQCIDRRHGLRRSHIGQRERRRPRRPGECR